MRYAQIQDCAVHQSAVYFMLRTNFDCRFISVEEFIQQWLQAVLLVSCIHGGSVCRNIYVEIYIIRNRLEITRNNNKNVCFSASTRTTTSFPGVH